MDVEGYSTILRELHCPICINYMFPPILQCTNGHSFCETCYLRLKLCPACQSGLTGVRNRSLEAVAEAIAGFPCTNQKNGCELKMPIEILTQHQLVCKYREVFPCIKVGCDWVGRREDLLEHWCSKRLDVPAYGDDNVCYMELSEGFYHVNIIKAHDQLFWFQQKIGKNKAYFVVQFIGNGEKSKFVYELQIGREKKHLLLRDSCKMVDWQKDDPTQMQDCLSVALEDINKYCTCKMMTHYRMRVLQL